MKKPCLASEPSQQGGAGWYAADMTTPIPDTLDPLQFASRPNRSTDDTVSVALQSALAYLDKRNPYVYVRRLFIDYSSVFNTIAPSRLNTKLRILGLNTRGVLTWP